MVGIVGCAHLRVEGYVLARDQKWHANGREGQQREFCPNKPPFHFVHRTKGKRRQGPKISIREHRPHDEGDECKVSDDRASCSMASEDRYQREDAGIRLSSRLTYECGKERQAGLT